MNKWTKNLFSNKGITGIDLAIAIIIILTFTGIVSSLMYSTYATSISVKKAAEADAYATIILEKVDEKAYDEVDNNFVEKLEDNNEIVISDDYTITFNVEPCNYELDLVKKVNVTVQYTLDGKEKKLVIDKLKVKEIGE